MNRFLALWRRLFPAPAEPGPLRVIVMQGLATEEHEADWRNGYNVGRAQGQLEGRQALSNEIEQEFGLHAGQEAMTPDDAKRIKARQVH